MTEFAAGGDGFNGCHWVPFGFEVFTVIVHIVRHDRSIVVKEIFDKAAAAADREAESGVAYVFEVDGGDGFDELVLEFRFNCNELIVGS